MWLDDAAGWLAIALYRSALRRLVDGRLPSEPPAPGDPRSPAERLGDLEHAWHERAAAVRATYATDVAAQHLADAFELDGRDLDLIVLAAAANRETALLHALSTLRPPGVEAALHVGLLAELASAGRDDEQAALAALGAGGRLGRWRLLELGLGHGPEAPFVARAVHVPQRVLVAAAGSTIETSPEVELRHLAIAGDPRTASPALAIARRALGDAGRGLPSIIALAGPPGSGRTRLAAALVAEHGRPLVELALHLVPGDAAGFDAAIRVAAREVRLCGGWLALGGLDAIPADERARRVERCVRVLDVLDVREPIIAIGGDRDAARASGRDVVWIDVAPPSAADRTRLLDDALGTAPRAIDDEQVAAIAGTYPLSPDALEAAARDAIRAAIARTTGAHAGHVDTGDLFAACRAQLDHRMSALADPVRGRVTFDDIVIDDETRGRMREMIAYVSHADTVFDRWGFATRVQARGISALFSGPPGTGKTLAASVLATELGLELFRIDLSRIVSKYIGETETNLARVFAEATNSRAILLFDEADSLFAKRTEVKSSVDRYANMEVNYLLQRMESFDGISILTTNHESAIDEAFRRRLQFRLRFEAPDVAMRERLWRQIIPRNAALDRAVNFRELARRFDMTGGYIRNAAVRAAFLSASRGTSISMRELLDAGEREIEEMGRVTRRTDRPERVSTLG